ncbi:MAG: hypothetical protein EBX41_03240, partial [Chitinophagia bacterium]|nr:hypothetical protein [Chitinophagia bacterium]
MPDFQILAQTFNLETWKAYLHDLFPQANIYTDLQYIALPANNIAENGGKVGELTTSDGKKLGIYHINLKENTNIARNKAGTRGLLRSQYSLNDDGIIATYKQGNQWRLSYISEINTYNP